MRFLIDAQLPPAVARLIASHGQEARAVRDVGLRDASDAEIWTFASQGNWAVVTKDEGFVDRTMRETAGPQVVWIRIGNSTNRALLDCLDPLLPDVIREILAGQRVVEVKRGSNKAT